MGLGLLLLASIAEAEPIDATPAEERAEELFREAKQLMSAGDYPEACPKLAESQRLDPGGGTLLTLALCYEGAGMLATAWSTFRAAADRARTDQRADREAISEQHMSELAPRLSRLTVRFAAETASLAGLEVLLDGRRVDPATLAAGLPVDPGSRRLQVHAPGRLPFEQRVDIDGEAVRAEIRVPELAPEVAPEPEPPPTPPALRPVRRRPPPDAPAPERSMAPTAIAGWTIGAASLLALGTGTYFGIRAGLHQSRANELCPTDHCGDPHAVALNDDARRSADIATATLVVGGAALATSLVLLLALPDEAPPGPLAWAW